MKVAWTVLALLLLQAATPWNKVWAQQPGPPQPPAVAGFSAALQQMQASSTLYSEFVLRELRARDTKIEDLEKENKEGKEKADATTKELETVKADKAKADTRVEEMSKLCRGQPCPDEIGDKNKNTNGQSE
jgi:uncharacterized protein (DUF3084 family)